VGPIFRSRLLSALVAFSGLMTAWVVTADQELGFPLVLVEQGVTSLRFGNEIVNGETVPRYLFVIRDGSVVTVFGKRTPGTGSRLFYCPNERFFVSPDDEALYDREGRYVQGPGTGDMVEYRRTINTEDLTLFIGGATERPRSKGEISGAAAEKYLNWRADPDTQQKFCQDPIR
jgi:hypothetical protein